MTKTELRKKFEKSTKQILDELMPIQEKNWKKGFLGKEKWSIHQIVSHIVGWDQLCLDGIRGFIKGKRPLYSGYKDKEFEVLNLQFIKKYSGVNKEEILLKFIDSREKLFSYLKSLNTSEIMTADSRELFWGGMEGEKMTFENVVDTTWHDREHIEHIQKFKREHLAVFLKKKTTVYLYPEKPFSFDYSFYNPSHFPTGDVFWEHGKKWQTLAWKNNTLGLKFEDESNSEIPKIKLIIYSEHALPSHIVDEVIKEINWRYNLSYDLSFFYKQSSGNTILRKLIKKYQGMQIFHSGSLYEYFVIGIVLQNAPLYRTIKMMQSLFEYIGHSVYFDNKYLFCFWNPSEVLKVSEESLRKLKLGYRAKSFLDITHEYIKRKINEEKLRNYSKEKQREILLEFPGIGPATSEYILCDVFHHYFPLIHIPPWERKLYSMIFFKSARTLSEKKLLSFLNKEFGTFVKIAIHYFWADVWWRRENGEKIDWLENEIRK